MQNEWKNISFELCNKLMDSIPKRIVLQKQTQF